MSITAKCDLCGVELEVDDRLAGQTADCPKCKQSFLVPTPTKSSIRVSGQSSSDIARRVMGADHTNRIQGSRKVAGYFSVLGTVALILCVVGAVLAADSSIWAAIVLVGAGVFNFFLWRAVHYVLHLLADIEENTRLLR